MTVDTRHETRATGANTAPEASASPRTAPRPARMPGTMTAVVQHRYGGSEVLGIEQVDRPTPGPGEVLVRVRAAGLDRGTWHLMAGLPYLTRLMFGFRKPKYPTPGLDVAGNVAALGEGVDGFAIGDRVFGIAISSFAEYAVAPVAKLQRMPRGIDFDAAAVVPISGLTGLQAVEAAGVSAGQRVLITGASGGVGSYAVQVAAAAGAEVTAVASAGKADYVRSLGATRAIDYRTTDVTTLDERFDAIIDINGNAKVRRMQRILAPEGTLIMVGGEKGGKLTGGFQRQLSAPLRNLFTRQTIRGLMSIESGDDIARLAGMIEQGSLRAPVSEVYPLRDVRRAMDDLVEGRLSGKASIHVAD
mgnify:FL=1